MTEAIKTECRGITTGKLKEVPQMSTSKGGKKYCRFKLEVAGEKYPDWFDFVAWEAKAEEICKCKCGSVITVKFPMKNNSYTDKNGQKQSQPFKPDPFGKGYEIKVISQPEAGAESAKEEGEIDDLPF